MATKTERHEENSTTDSPSRPLAATKPEALISKSETNSNHRNLKFKTKNQPRKGIEGYQVNRVSGCGYQDIRVSGCWTSGEEGFRYEKDCLSKKD